MKIFSKDLVKSLDFEKKINYACRYAKNLKQFIYDLCKRKADKGWMAQAMIVVSNTRSNSTQLKYVNGKPRLIINDIIVDKIYHGNYKTD